MQVLFVVARSAGSSLGWRFREMDTGMRKWRARSEREREDAAQRLHYHCHLIMKAQNYSYSVELR